ncbi:MAG: UTP--glucose-1-phosphate uridylyltransferase [Planctomycetota bacterium]
MPPSLAEIVTSSDPEVRNLSLDAVCRDLSLDELLAAAGELDRLWRRSDNLYERVRALFFLYSIHRFHLPERMGSAAGRHVPYDGYQLLLHRRFGDAVDAFQTLQESQGPSDAWSSALARAYHELGFQTLADQVRRSVRSVDGNRWMFELKHAGEHPLRVVPELLATNDAGLTPVLRESTPVRMDLTHSGWSDIFFLGMDFPEAAKVLNVSIDLGVVGRDPYPRPPVESYFRVIDEPVLRLVSVDLETQAEITELGEVFDFAKDYLGLLKAAVIASGVVPPSLEGSSSTLRELLTGLVGEGRGIELTSYVRGIPKGSRLAVSTNLLASLIVLCMRATGQARALQGDLEERERRLVVARAILGEWLGGSGGGWQDSGGLWPGIKRIEGALAQAGDPEFGVSRGRLLPDTTLLDDDAVPEATRRALQRSLVLVHGGMAQDVGPILEMVTEKYLLRSEAEWQARHRALGVLDSVLDALRSGDIRALGQATTDNFFGPIQTIIPWATNLYTERVIERVRERFGGRFWGFWMLGGMSGGGMGFIFDPRDRDQAQGELLGIMQGAKRELEDAMPFAMDPVVYDFAINPRGSHADLLVDETAPFPPEYYALRIPWLIHTDPKRITPQTRSELRCFGEAARNRLPFTGIVQQLFDRLFPATGAEDGASSLSELLERHGFDREQHEAIRADLSRGRIGLARNRLPADTRVEDVLPEDVVDPGAGSDAERAECERRGLASLAAGECAVVTLAAGSGSRWTQGAGVVKGLFPVCRFDGRHRSFLEVHLAKSRRTSELAGKPLPHVITTSYLTHDPIERYLDRHDRYDYPGPLHLSPGRAVGLRLVPMVRDLRFAWEEMPQQLLDEQAQKVRESLQGALLSWAQSAGEGSDYVDNLPHQCLHPVGHWYEVPNLLLNGTLRKLFEERPALRTLLLHNVDTLGADVDPVLLGLHLGRGSAISFEVVPRRIEDRGGGLARVNGRPRLVESLALPREEDEFRLSYYNSMTTWIDVQQLLDLFGLERGDLGDERRVQAAVRGLASRMPTYITLKDVKKRWGYGQEDVFPIAQFEKLWSDMTALAELPPEALSFFAVPRKRGQQLKEPAQLDGWLRDGSAAHVGSLCSF